MTEAGSTSKECSKEQIEQRKCTKKDAVDTSEKTKGIPVIPGKRERLFEE